MPLELQRGDVVLELREQLHGQEPPRQRQLGGRERRAAGDAALVLTAPALPVAPVFSNEGRAGADAAAGRADEATVPALLDEGLLALLLGTVALEELVHRQAGLELNSVHGHGPPPKGDAAMVDGHWLMARAC